MECLSAIGVAESFLEAARPIRKMVFADEGKKIAEVPLAEGLDTLWPTPLILPQSETERLLLAFVEKQGVSVARNAECIEVQTAMEGVICKLKHADGTTEEIEAGWLAGCDGARSFVRHTLPISFTGVTEEISFILADAKADGQLRSDSILASAGAGGTVLIFPVARDIWRIFALREDLSDRSQPTLEEIQRHLDGSGLERIRLFDPIWLSHFAVNERVVSRNRVGRVFLLGDAAHIHSPAGGQGMNTGMQDAFNLGWKFKLLVESLGDAEAIGESYFAERHPVAEKVARNTSRMLHFGINNNAALRRIKRGILPLLSRVEAVKKKLAYELSEIGIAYSRSPLIQKDSAAVHQHDLAPGCRARPVEVTRNGLPGSLWFELLHPGHTLLVFLDSLPLKDARDAIGPILTEPPGAWRTLFIQRTPDRSETNGVETLLDPAGRAHSRYGTRQPSWYLIRPDQYVAARGTLKELDPLQSYIRRTLTRQ